MYAFLKALRKYNYELQSKSLHDHPNGRKTVLTVLVSHLRVCNPSGFNGIFENYVKLRWKVLPSTKPLSYQLSSQQQFFWCFILKCANYASWSMVPRNFSCVCLQPSRCHVGRNMGFFRSLLLRIGCRYLKSVFCIRDFDSLSKKWHLRLPLWWLEIRFFIGWFYKAEFRPFLTVEAL